MKVLSLKLIFVAELVVCIAGLVVVWFDVFVWRP
jgi:hypothetical protein